MEARLLFLVPGHCLYNLANFSTSKETQVSVSSEIKILLQELVINGILEAQLYL
jgi:hypothetical protein